ncbi:hypothetical protein [Chryseobacterium taklimakanense]|uniref:hypothetical protein n=1 Tax=Chryseobacterium taklimakanense TaxID=536441 RepID=UPI0023F8C390|nr:hypothetical protein [Chryseobacterium taklimakanense]
MKHSLSAGKRLFFCCGEKTDTKPGKQQIRHGYYEFLTALQEPDRDIKTKTNIHISGSFFSAVPMQNPKPEQK